MNKEEVRKLVDLRMMLLQDFQKRKDWKNNRNAIMREIEYVEIIETTIKKLDSILSGHVTFS